MDDSANKTNVIGRDPMFWRGAYRDAVTLLQTVAERAHDVPNGQTIECEALRMVGHGLIRLRSFEPAERCLETCLALACSLRDRDPKLEANAHIALGKAIYSHNTFFRSTT